MRLVDIVEQLAALPGEHTIYAAEPWLPDSEAISTAGPESEIARQRGLKYFLEVFIALEVLEPYAEIPSEEKCNRLIRYAETDA